VEGRFRPVPLEAEFFLAFPAPQALLEGLRLGTLLALVELMGQAKRS
jgi:hypothetical protein